MLLSTKRKSPLGVSEKELQEVVIEGAPGTYNRLVTNHIAS